MENNVLPPAFFYRTIYFSKNQFHVEHLDPCSSSRIIVVDMSHLEILY